MRYRTIILKSISVEVQLSFFGTETGSTECHAMLHTLNTSLNAAEQIKNLETAVRDIVCRRHCRQEYVFSLSSLFYERSG